MQMKTDTYLKYVGNVIITLCWGF